MGHLVVLVYPYIELNECSERYVRVQLALLGICGTSTIGALTISYKCMAMFKSDGSTGKQGDTVIGAAVKVEGNFVGEGNVIVEGQLQGTLKTKHNVIIGSGAIVKANVEAQDVHLAGELHGNVKISGKLTLTATAKLSGNIETSSLTVEEGATLNGKCVMTAGAKIEA